MYTYHPILGLMFPSAQNDVFIYGSLYVEESVRAIFLSKLTFCFRFTDLNSLNMSMEKLSPADVNYRAIVAYNQSKLCNILFSNELNRRLYPYKVFCNSIHPGNVISTKLSRHWWFWRLLFALVRPFAKSKVSSPLRGVVSSKFGKMQN